MYIHALPSRVLISWITFFVGMALALPVLAEDDFARLDASNPLKLFTVTAGSCTAVTGSQGRVFIWRPQVGETARLTLRSDVPVFSRLRYFDRLQCEFRLRSGEINSLDLRAKGHVSGARQYKLHQWTLAVRTTCRDDWQFRDIDLTRPNWFEWDSPDGTGDEALFQLETMGLAPNTVIELRNLRLVRGVAVLKPDYELPVTWPVKTTNADGSITYTATYQVLNASGQPDRLTAAVVSTHQRFSVAIAKPTVEVKAAGIATFTLTAVMSKADIAATDDLYAEPLRLSFTFTRHPDAAVYWQGMLVRPLSSNIHRQVVLPERELATAKAALAAGNTDMQRLLNIGRLRAIADDFCTKRLAHIPVGNAHVTNAYPTNWQPAEIMPDAVNTKTGERQSGTALAGTAWKEYLGYSGQACENLGMAYLLTGEEQYARKAIELFTLYGRQYTELAWRNMFDPPWNAGPNILGSSRVAGNSTYGTNWYFKDHCRLLSMIADSPSWTLEQRQLVYTGFVLPLATEMMKVYPPISNQSDITNHDLLLLGLACDDAGLVREALYRDAGLLKRLDDLDADGFSSEGRPINYHFGEMDEFLPSLAYLANASLRIELPRKRLLAAFRMPYYRAALDGRVPNSGDCGRWQAVGVNARADYLSDLFPEEAWLGEIGGMTTLAKKVRASSTPMPSDPQAWKRLLDTEPRLFPAAGMAILRTGTTPETQIMVTLDYGRSVFHNALDRNQITLYAFGKIFSHGPGSLYNAGTNGMTRRRDARLESFIGSGSLGHNVILVDAQNQRVGSGELLAWSAQPAYQVAVSRVPAITDGVSHTRGVVLTEGIVILLDRLESTRHHTYDFIYHNFGFCTLAEGWIATPEAQPLASTANYGSIGNLQRLHGDGPVRLNWDLSAQLPPAELIKRKEQRPLPMVGLRLWHLARPGDALFTGVTGMNNPNTATVPDDAPSFIHRVTGSTVQFFTVLEPYTGTSRVTAVSPAGKGVAITLNDGKRVVVSFDALIAAYPASRTP